MPIYGTIDFSHVIDLFNIIKKVSRFLLTARTQNWTCLVSPVNIFFLNPGDSKPSHVALGCSSYPYKHPPGHYRSNQCLIRKNSLILQRDRWEMHLYSALMHLNTPLPNTTWVRKTDMLIPLSYNIFPQIFRLWWSYMPLGAKGCSPDVTLLDAGGQTGLLGR